MENREPCGLFQNTMVGGVSFDIDIDYWRLTFDLSIDVEKLWVVVVGVGVP